MHRIVSRLGVLSGVISIAVAGLGPAHASHCLVPDNGTGTADFPPACASGYRNTTPYLIVNGLPPGDTIEGNGRLGTFLVFVEGPGGSLGGEFQQWTGKLPLDLSGTGSLAGFMRSVSLPVQGETHTAPVAPGDPNQPYGADLFTLEGQITGDPDFDLLRITAGTGFGMPSPGHTTLQLQPGGQWAVDSFFDITYRIDFVGAATGPLSGMSGSTTGSLRIEIPFQQISPGEDHWATIAESEINFGADVPAIPAGFLYPGSPPFSGFVPMRGQPRDPASSNADTIVRRTVAVDLPTIGSTQTIPIEIVSLGLVSVAPIDVGGVFYDVAMRLDPTGTNGGTMTIGRERIDGGVFRSSFTVRPLFLFTPVGGGPSTLYNGLPDIGYDNRCGNSWSEESPSYPPLAAGPGFWPEPHPAIAHSGSAFTRLTAVPGTMAQPYSLCVAKDNGTGTADFPPACPGGYPNDPNDPIGYDIVNGLPPGSTLQGRGPLKNLMILATAPGGSLGGEIQQTSADLELTLSGTGAFSGYLRTFVIPHILETHTAPHPSFVSPQDFQTVMWRMGGQLPPGDPDFDLLRISAGNAFGLPSPGHTTLGLRPDGQWAVDSFFDITYRIDFVGNPTGPFAGMSGSTQATTRILAGSILWHPMGECRVPDAAGSADIPAVCGSGYGSPPESIRITNGLPAGSSMEVQPDLSSVVIQSVFPGGSLGGDVTLFDGRMLMRLDGTGAAGSIHRRIPIPVSGENHNGPKSPGLPQQKFDMSLETLQGQITGDPDFDLLRITTGNAFGLPAGGSTYIVNDPNQPWAVDSFFDITYRIDYVGSPGGPLVGMSGSEVGRVRLQAGLPAVPGGPDPWATQAGTAICLGCGSLPPVPPDFFYPGSAPFSGFISMTGDPNDPLDSNADTLFQRLAPARLPRVGDSEIVPAELVSLNLISLSPFSPDGVNFYDVLMRRAPASASSGWQRLVRGTPDGGGFLTYHEVEEQIAFRPVGGGATLLLPAPLRSAQGACFHAYSNVGPHRKAPRDVPNPLFMWGSPPYIGYDPIGLATLWLQARRAIGACCEPSGACSEVTARDCVGHLGLPQGVGTICLGDSNGDLIDEKCSAAIPPEVSPPGAPVPFHAEIVAGGQLRLTWQPTLGAAAYHLFRADPADLRPFGGFNSTTAGPFLCGHPGVSIVLPMPPGNLALAVAADNAVGTGPIGFDSGGNPESAVPCP